LHTCVGLSYVAAMADDEEVDSGAYEGDLEDESGEKTGVDLADLPEDDSDTVPPDESDEKVKHDRGEVA
jgi:hypothetical protein